MVEEQAGEPIGFSARVTATPDRPALVLGDDVLTYRGLDDRSTRLAHALAARGVGEGDRVAIMLPNGLEGFETWAAGGKLHASVVLVNWHLKADEVAWILADSGARVLVAASSLRDGFAGAVERVGCDLVVVGDGNDGVGAADYEAVLASGEGPPLPLDVLAPPVFYTSGTTGRPKGVVHGTFDGERARLAQHGQVALWGWQPDDVYLLSGPAYHAGPGGFAMSALFVGATTVILPTWDAREWLGLVEQHQVTLTFMVPAHFIRVLEVPDGERTASDLSSLRLVVHAGAPCPVPVKQRMIEALPGTEIWELYGMSEGGATRISPEEWLARPGSVGRPWPGTEVRVLDDDGRPLGPGETGLVYVRPAGGARFHYHDDPDKTAGAWRDDAFTVGDVGHLDADGYLYLTDRASDLVIRGGVNVYPREVEDVLFAHPAVVDCAVFGVPDERLGEQLKAVVEVREPTTPDALRDFCAERLASFKVPATVELVDELPRQPNGKVLKRLLREQAWAGRETRIG